MDTSRGEYEQGANDALTKKRSPPGHLNLRVTLKHWAMFHAVVEYGSYAKAAASLNISQPTVSYAITQIESQLGMPLLRVEGRKAKLTIQGKKLLEQCTLLLHEATRLEAFAHELQKTWKAEIGLAVDEGVPPSMLVPALRMFTTCGNGARVTLIEGPMRQVEAVLREQIAELAIGPFVPDGLQGEHLFSLEYVPVAHPNHPLLRLGRPLTAADMEQETEIIPKQNVGLQSAKDSGLRNHRLWRVTNIETAERALAEGLGYAWLPKQRVANALQQGALGILPMQDQAAYELNFYLMQRPIVLSSEAARLADTLRSFAARKII